jgi:hypothetical protein
MDITGGIVSGNSASAEGGGLWNGSGLMSLTAVTVDNNTAVGNGPDQGGGGVFNAGGSVDMVGTTISRNQVTGAGSGGGLHNDAEGAVTINLSTISGNQSSNGGGGVTNNGELTLTACTVAENMSATEGGGIMQRDSANSTTIVSSIVAGNISDVTGQEIAGSGAFVSGGYNLIGEDDGNVFSEGATDQEGTAGMPIDANLDLLADNGGATQTHALMCPSPAIDMGDPDNNAFDQTASPVFGQRRDIGAFEYQELCDPNATTGAIGDLRGSEIFPNPVASGSLHVSIPEHFGSDATIRVIEMSSGKQISEVVGGTGRVALDINALVSGTFIVQIRAKDSVESHKLVVIRN